MDRSGGPSARGHGLPSAAPWVAEVVRAQRAPVPWLDMLRAAVAICVPLGAGLAAGRPQVGLLVAIGGLLGSVVDRGGPYPARFRRVACAALLGGVPGLTLGTLIHGRGWLAVAVLVLVAGVSALISTIGDTASVTGLQLLVYSAFGTGPLGALRPWWTVPVLFVGGVAWAMALLLPGWLSFPYTGQERRVAAVYAALAAKLDAIGTGRYPQSRRGVTAALNVAYDEVLTARSGAGGRDRRLARLVSLLNQAHLLAEAATALALAGERPPPAVTGTVAALAGAIGQRGPPPVVPALPTSASAGMLTLHEGIAGAADLLASQRSPAGPPARAGGARVTSARVAGARGAGARGAAARVMASRAAGRLERARNRLASVLDELRGGRLTRMFVLRLMASAGVASVFSEVLPLQRSYWVVLTVAIVLKPDFGSVFVRAVQRGIGTVVGAVIGALLLAALPSGPLLLIPLAVCAALLPYGRSRNYGLFSVFITPAVVLLIDLLARQGWQLAEARLIDTLVGCGIVLVIGYGPWPGHWHADMPQHFAAAVDCVADFTRQALAPDPPAPAGAGPRQPEAPGRAQLRRQTYRALSDLRLEFQRTMAEPATARRVAAAWWPAVVALEQAMDAVTAVAVAADRGAPLPPAPAVEDLVSALHQVAAAVRSGTAPPSWPDLAVPGPLAPVAEAVRGVHEALSPQQAA